MRLYCFLPAGIRHSGNRQPHRQIFRIRSKTPFRHSDTGLSGRWLHTLYRQIISTTRISYRLLWHYRHFRPPEAGNKQTAGTISHHAVASPVQEKFKNEICQSSYVTITRRTIRYRFNHECGQCSGHQFSWSCQQYVCQRLQCHPNPSHLSRKTQ